MKDLITLKEYFDIVGEDIFPGSWSMETVYYYSDRKDKFIDLKAQARETYKKAINQIWKDGKIFVCPRLEQGHYFEPTFAIEDFDFAQSLCYDKQGKPYQCRVQIKKIKGRKKTADKAYPYIFKYVQMYHVDKNVPLENIVAESVVSFVQEELRKAGARDIPQRTAIVDRLHEKYPECAKTSRNSKY